MDSDLLYTEAGQRKLIDRIGVLMELLTELRHRTIHVKGLPWSVVFPLLWAFRDTAHSICILCGEKQMRDSVVLSRTALETAVNALYISACAAEVAERAERHAVQKWYRDLRRYWALQRNVFGRKMPPFPEPEKGSLLQSCLEEFTSSRGSEIIRWTTDSMAQRLAAIRTRYGDGVGKLLDLSVSSLYRDSSEVIHGTLYGAYFATGQVRSLSFNQDVMDRWQPSWMGLTLFAIACVSHAVIRALASHFEIADIARRSTECVSELADVILPSADYAD